MTEALLAMGIAAMYFHTGTVDQRFIDASYKQTNIDKLTQKAEEKYVPDELRAPLGNLAIVITAVYERRITYTWRY